MSLRATAPRGVPPLVHKPVSLGPQRKNDTLPVGMGGFAVPAPSTVAKSVTGVPRATIPPAPALGVVVSVAVQLANCPSTKSLRVADVDVDERVSAETLEKHSSA